MLQARPGRYLVHTGQQRLQRIVGHEGGGIGGSRKKRPVNPVLDMRNDGVPVRQFGRGGRVAGAGVAVDIGPDLGADPFAEWIPYGGRFGRGDTQHEVLVGDPLGGVGHVCRNALEPGYGDVGSGKVEAVSLQVG